MTRVNKSLKVRISQRRFMFLVALLLLMTYKAAPTASADESLNKKTCFFDEVKLRLSMLTDGFRKRNIRERDPDIVSDLEFLEEKKSLVGLGVVATEYDTKFKTRVYYTATAKPLADGTIPRIDPAARANFIYFHGSGTQAAGGNTFSGKQNSLASLGYSSIGFDYPWHKDGNTSRDMLDEKKFLKYLDEFIQAHRVPGQPVYLVGHSFGPDLIANYIRHYPNGVDGAVMLSGPMGFTPELKSWYENETTKMQQFWQDTKNNEKGGTWAGKVSSSGDWADVNSKLKDPTENPNFKLRVMVGQDEEYIPKELDENGLPKKGTPLLYDYCAAIKKIFKNITCTVEPGVGHMIFAHRDAEGSDIIMRELAAVNGEDIKNAKEMKKALPQKVELDVFAQKYRLEPMYRKWFDGKYGHAEYLRLLSEKDNKGIKLIQTEWKTVLEQRNVELMQHIKDTEKWAPEFFAQNKDGIEALDLSKPHTAETSSVVSTYREFLKTVKPETQKQYATASDKIFVIPEKTPRPEKPQKPEKVAKAQAPKNVAEEAAQPEAAPAPAPVDSSADVEAKDDSNRSPSSVMPPWLKGGHHDSSYSRARYLVD